MEDKKKVHSSLLLLFLDPGSGINIPSATLGCKLKNNCAFLLWIPAGAGHSEKPDNRAAAGEPEHHTQHTGRGDLRPTREGDLGRGYQVRPPIHPDGLPSFVAAKVC
jgi:hypothetical protein